MSYITTYSILRKQRVMSVLVLTVAYLAVINTFTDYNSNWAIVRTVLEGFYYFILHWQVGLQRQIELARTP